MHVGRFFCITGHCYNTHLWLWLWLLNCKDVSLYACVTRFIRCPCNWCLCRLLWKAKRSSGRRGKEPAPCRPRLPGQVRLERPRASASSWPCSSCPGYLYIPSIRCSSFVLTAMCHAIWLTSVLSCHTSTLRGTPLCTRPSTYHEVLQLCLEPRSVRLGSPRRPRCAPTTCLLCEWKRQRWW